MYIIFDVAEVLTKCKWRGILNHNYKIFSWQRKAAEELEEKIMSITRKMLKGMALTDEQIDTIIEAHTETVDALKDERDKFKADASELVTTRNQLEALKKEIENGDSFEDKYNKLKKEFDDYKSEQSAMAEKSAKETAYKEMLKSAGVSEKRIASIMRVTNLADVKLDKEGKLKDYDKLVDGVKAEWSDFIDTKDVKGADTKTPPTNSGGKMTKDDIMNIKDASERQQAIADNHELFGF